MKVLHVYKDFFPPVAGGIERHVSLMCKHQRAHADVSALVCSRRFTGGTREADGVSVVEVGEWGRFQGAPISPAFPYRLATADADVVVVQTPNPTAEISTLFRRQGRLVVRYQSDIVRQARAMRVYQPLFHRYLKRADRIVASSSQYIDTSPHLSAYTNNCEVIPLGIEPERFETVDESAVGALREKYGGPFVFFCGRHVYYKGIEYLIDAAQALDAPVVIGGAGPLTPDLQSRARACGDSIHFTGMLSEDDLRHHLHACAVFAFPSVERSEAFGISMLEAHACGKPVVATSLGTGVEYVNRHEVTGLNVPPRNAEALAGAITRLLRNTALATELGEAARERVRSEFDARQIAQLELELYASLL